MVALYLTSSAAGSGRTTVAAGLGKQLLARNKKVGFFKPILSTSQQGANGDAELMRDIFGLEEPAEIISPSFSDESTLKNNVKSAFGRAAASKDIVIIEGIPGSQQVTNDLAGALDARVMAVEVYSNDISGLSSFYRSAGKRLIGLALNKVPRSRLAQAKADLSKLSQGGVNALGSIPEDRSLLSLSVAGLAREVKGNIVGQGDTSLMVENIMMGAMTPDPGALYYGRKANKAVILKSGRPDMQLAALGTSTRCLVLVGEAAPIPMVLAEAEKKNIPVISAKDDIATVIASIEQALRNTRFNRDKAARAAELVGESLRLDGLYSGLGL